MLLLVSGATTYPRGVDVGHLIVPAAGNSVKALIPQLAPGRWAMDNGCFGGFNVGAFMRMLDRFDGVPGCLFVTVPDFVGDAASTREAWPFWAKAIRGLGYKPALVAQNGLTVDTTPWAELGALFIGGDDAFKDG